MEIILTNCLIWVVGAFAVASLLMVFFTTKFTQHLFEIARKLGYHRKDPEFYRYSDAALDYKEDVGRLTRGDMDKWLLHGPFGAKHRMLAELLTCPGCMSMQLGLWLGLLTAVVTGQWWYWPAAFLSWPSAGRVIFKNI
jgi:hypothetical protein